MVHSHGPFCPRASFPLPSVELRRCKPFAFSHIADFPCLWRPQEAKEVEAEKVRIREAEPAAVRELLTALEELTSMPEADRPEGYTEVKKRLEEQLDEERAAADEAEQAAARTQAAVEALATVEEEAAEWARVSHEEEDAADVATLQKRLHGEIEALALLPEEERGEDHDEQLAGLRAALAAEQEEGEARLEAARQERQAQRVRLASLHTSIGDLAAVPPDERSGDFAEQLAGLREALGVEQRLGELRLKARLA